MWPLPIHEGEVLSLLLGRYEGNLLMVIIHWPLVPLRNNLHWFPWRNEKVQHFPYKSQTFGPCLYKLVICMYVIYMTAHL